MRLNSSCLYCEGCKGLIQNLLLLQMKKLDGVATDHLVFFRFRHADKVSFNNIHGVGPVGFLMRKVRAPDQAIDIDLVAQLDPDPVELKSPKAMLTDIFARQTGQRLETEQALGPANVAIITDVGPLQEKGNPPNLVFGEEDSQVGKAVEQAGQNPLNRGHRAVSPNGSKAAHLVHEIVSEFFHQLFGFVRILE